MCDITISNNKMEITILLFEYFSTISTTNNTSILLSLYPISSLVIFGLLGINFLFETSLYTCVPTSRMQHFVKNSWMMQKLWKTKNKNQLHTLSDCLFLGCFFLIPQWTKLKDFHFAVSNRHTQASIFSFSLLIFLQIYLHGFSCS